MEIREPGKVFIDTLLIGPSDVSKIEENHNIPDEEDFEDDGSHFTTETVEDITATDIYGNLEGPPTLFFRRWRKKNGTYPNFTPSFAAA